MPYTQNGLKPDIIINPHAFPSRMTIGQLVEVIYGKCGLYYGAHGDCTAFLNKGDKYAVLGRLLADAGYSNTGNEVMYSGETGEQLQSSIYIGPTYYMRLKHMVKDKINYRSQGPRTLLTRQTVQGRANDGGLRMGEMERDTVIAHGVSKFMQDSMLNRGDEYYMAICNKTGTIAIYNESRDLFLSPMCDGPIKFNGELEEDMSIVNISKHGRDFSVVKVPYTFKLLMHELMAMNVQIRVITDANIDQMMSMSYSNNINLLLHDPNVTPKQINERSEALREDKTPADKPSRFAQDYTAVPPPGQYGAPPFMIDSPDYQPQSPGYQPISPGYQPQSPRYQPISPDYIPYGANRQLRTTTNILITPIWCKSPSYAPPQNSPDYTPYGAKSPSYAPPQNSPDYTPYGAKSPNYAPPPNSNSWMVGDAKSPSYAPDGSEYGIKSPSGLPPPPQGDRFSPYSPPPPGGPTIINPKALTPGSTEIPANNASIMI